jgi:outer membrane protein assembly factor BamB
MLATKTSSPAHSRSFVSVRGLLVRRLFIREADASVRAMFRSALILFALCATLRAENWPMWRGPRLDGTAANEAFPTQWSGSENITWQTALPGAGHASPVVWNDRIFTVSANAETNDRLLLCLERRTGKLRWQSVVINAPLERLHRLNSHASSTPATDGERVYTTFLDGETVVVAAHNFDGKQVWLKKPGKFASVHGFCSSPILFEERVIVNCDHDGDGYIVALDRKDGRELWRIARPNNTRSYCVPIIREVAGRTQMVLSGSKCVTSYDPRTGKLLWIIDGPTEQFVASLVYNPRVNLFFLTAGYPQHHILAIRPDGSGNVTNTHVAWRTTKGAAYVPSPITVGDYFLVTSDSGVAFCFDARSGTILWQERVGEQHASLVAANGLVYFVNDNGTTHIVRPGARYELVARNELGERTFASPALSDGQIFLRTENHLVCIGQPHASQN